METLLPYALLCLTSIFTLANPLGTMPVFLTMTHGMSEKQRRSIVKRATITAVLILIVFTFAGQFIFMFFGISTNGFRIAGGVIIFKIGYDMLQARYTHVKLNPGEIKTYADDISITPLGIPMLCGPGAIANTIVLMSDAHTITMLDSLHLHTDVLHTTGLNTPCKRARRDRQQRNDATHGPSANGNRRGMFRRRHEAYPRRRNQDSHGLTILTDIRHQ